MIWAETQMCIKCDTCGVVDTAVIPRKDFITMQRKRGWSIGERAICPNCRKLHQVLKATEGKR